MTKYKHAYRQVRVKNKYAKVEIDVQAWITCDDLTPDERRRTADYLASRIMLAVQDMPYIGQPLCCQRSKRIR